MDEDSRWEVEPISDPDSEFVRMNKMLDDHYKSRAAAFYLSPQMLGDMNSNYSSYFACAELHRQYFLRSLGLVDQQKADGQ